MTRKPSIPMTPTALPKQRSPEETVLPCRPEGFQGYCDWYDAIPEALKTKQKPRATEYLGAVEWAWSPMHGRFTGLYLSWHRRHWGLWIACPDDDDPLGESEWDWQLYGWARRRSESWEAAAAWLLVDAWQSEEDHGSIGRFSFVADAGVFSAVGLNELADEVWPRPSRANHRERA